ncbi:retrovirus-related pol polyprotein from transposon TNT 1-94 [Tanacetum coccineum]
MTTLALSWVMRLCDCDSMISRDTIMEVPYISFFWYFDQLLKSLTGDRSPGSGIVHEKFIREQLRCFYGQKMLLLLVTPKIDPHHFTTRHNKTPYELVHDKKPDLTFFRVFGALCYATNDSEDLGKLQPTADIGIFVGYAPSRKGYRIYNKRTRRIMETIHVQFDELFEPMAPVQLNTGPVPTFLTPGQISSGLVPNPVPAAPYVPLTNKDLEILFQPMFDEYLEPLRVERPASPTLAVLVNSATTPSSTTIDQDAPSPIIPAHLGIYNLQVPHQGGCTDLLSLMTILWLMLTTYPLNTCLLRKLNSSSEASSSKDAISTESTHVIQPHHHLEK